MTGAELIARNAALRRLMATLDQNAYLFEEDLVSLGENVALEHVRARDAIKRAGAQAYELCRAIERTPEYKAALKETAGTP